MLPEDTKARRAATLEAILHQTQVDGHFKVATPEDKPEPYSDQLFKDAAIQWLIETDQVSSSISFSLSFLINSQPLRSFEHQAFKNMIAIAARATKGVKIPPRTAMCDHIIKKFKEQMQALSERLNVSHFSLFALYD